MYDCLVIGAGPGGISASIYLKRSGLNIALIEKNMPGGRVSSTYVVENYPGYTSIGGADLASNMFNHAMSLGVEYISDMITEVIKNGDTFVIKGRFGSYETKKIIVAIGMENRTLGLENEDRLIGKGISFCAICDGFLYKGKDVAVVGGGKSALEEALYLSNIVNKVYLIHRRNEFRADFDVVDKIKGKNNIELFTPNTIKSINGDSALESITLDDDRVLNIDCLFEYIGFVPNVSFLNGLDISLKDGFIVVDKNQKTSVEGVYAVGDIVYKEVRQIVTAVSEGAIAALDVASNI